MSQSQLQETLASIDAINQQDPNKTESDGQWVANEWLYSQRMTQCLLDFDRQASEVLQIAVHAQHIQRWHIPRADYPMDRPGYKKWRSDLAAFHGETTAKLMAKAGYSEADQQRVKDILLKKHLKSDSEVQTLEDIACLVFLEHYLSAFAAKHNEEKLITIIRKTWNKMSDKGHSAALTLPLSDDQLALINKALSSK